MKFSERVKAAMEFAGIDQNELARLAVCSQPTISKIIQGKSESSTFTVQIAKACGVRPEWLAMEDGEMVGGHNVQDEDIKCAVLILEKLKAENKLDDALQILDLAFKHVKKAAA